MLNIPYLITVQTNDTFFGAISNTFANRPSALATDWTVILLYLAGILIVALSAALVFNLLKNRYHHPYKYPVGIFSEPNEINALLEQALYQRSRFDLTTKQNGVKGQNLYCTLTKVSRLSLVLEAPISNVENPEQWQGREVECYFKINTEKKLPIYYSLSTQIKQVAQRHKLLIMLLNRPKTIILRQKRAFFRVTPPADMISGLALWEEKIIPLEGEEQPLRQWGKPLLRYMPPTGESPGISEASDNDSFRLDNISAQGLRLEINNHFIFAKNLEFSISQHFIMLMELYDLHEDEGEPLHKTNKKIRFWLRLQVKSRFEDVKHTEVGLKIIGLGKIREDETGQAHIIWRELREDEVAPKLGDWVMKLHMMLYRISNTNLSSPGSRPEL